MLTDDVLREIGKITKFTPNCTDLDWNSDLALVIINFQLDSFLRMHYPIQIIAYIASYKLLILLLNLDRIIFTFA